MRKKNRPVLIPVSAALPLSPPDKQGDIRRSTCAGRLRRVVQTLLTAGTSLASDL